MATRRGLLATLGAMVAGAYEGAVARASGALKAAPATGSWLWPSSGGLWGNGDRGPPGSWQMNRGSPQSGLELMAFSAVYACVNTIASDIAKLPMQVWAINLRDGTRELRRSDYYATLFREPNSYQTSADFLQTFVQSYLMQGNTYCYIGQRNRRGEVEAMHILNPYRVRPLINQDDGAIFYECSEDYLAGLGAGQRVPERDMIHHRLAFAPGYPLVGVTPIFAASASSALGLKILQDSQQFFGNASRPSGLLSSPAHVSEETAARLKQEWDQAYRGQEFGKTALLSGGVTWQPLTITAQDAQLIEQLRYSVEDVARVFRVPPFMLGDMSKVTYRNTEQMGRAYLSGCLSFHIEALQQRFERAFDFPPSFEIAFDLAAFLRTEIDVRFAAYAASLNGGWQSINEVRAQEGLGPVDGGEEPRVQAQYVPLSQATGPPEPAPAAPPPPSEPPAEPPPEPAPESEKESVDATVLRIRAGLHERRLRRAA
jgi:HK97 family phage portal protein